MTELKPCPFCGGIASSRVVMLDEKTLDISAGCARCNVWYHSSACLPLSLETIQNVINKVVISWNRRCE